MSLIRGYQPLKHMKHFTKIIAVSLSIAGMLLSGDVEAQKDKDKGKKKKSEQPAEAKKEEDKYGDLIKKCLKSEGLFNIWRDTVSGKSYLEIQEDQLNKEYIYFSHITDGPASAGYFRGSYMGSKIVRFNKAFDRLEIIHENTDYYYDESSELSRAADANINDPVLANEKIEATSKDGKSILIDGDAIFLSEKFQMIKYPSPPGAPPGPLGSLSKDKTRLVDIKNYPKNTDMLVSYVYENSNPTFNEADITDPRSITIKYQHTILEVPDNNYQSRKDDPRIGYFSTEVTDMTSFDPTPWKDMIHRWNLVKKDPNARLSDPVEPITFWMENTTPKELRPTIKEACERWNMAFEKAGFTNAVVCLEQPDDVTWDAGDIRYNVLRWTSSPNPPFGGYGPSFVNPRTGEIIGADIMLEFVAIVNRVRAEGIFGTAGFTTDAMLEEFDERKKRNPFLCFASDQTNRNLAFGLTAGVALNMDAAAEKEIVKQLLGRLILHEVGHTLGLMHNMRASTLQSPADIKNKAKIDAEGLCNSVMEYPAFNYSADPKDQTLYCDSKPGFYDLWVIEYGYSAALSDPIAEEYRLNKIAERSSDPRLAFGNDADDMRSSGSGIDPDVNIYDLSSDPVTYGIERCDLVNSILPKLKDKFSKSNRSYQELLQAYLVATGEYAGQLRVMTRQIGGVHYSRANHGQESSRSPLVPVAEEKQKKAMQALSKYAFAPDAFKHFSDLYQYLLAQRRGFNFFGNNPDPHIHERILNMQKECLNQLLHPNVLTRITDSQLYGNTYSLDEVMTDLTNSIFQADAKSSVTTIRQNLQINYLERLVKITSADGKYDSVSKGMAIFELKRIDQMMTSGSSPDGLTKAHREHVRTIIKKALEA